MPDVNEAKSDEFGERKARLSAHLREFYLPDGIKRAGLVETIDVARMIAGALLSLFGNLSYEARAPLSPDDAHEIWYRLQKMQALVDIAMGAYFHVIGKFDGRSRMPSTLTSDQVTEMRARQETRRALHKKWREEEEAARSAPLPPVRLSDEFPTESTE
ncbi:hypothetical protein [Acidiferrobacter sp.]|jgi:hypothetical protein|uniref:hypothetical protein n=1 Tax=Acidiferrobacter sp. TaxID=1872107 RepID=UPI00261F875E|nr:hypothetical protein [Acidiferrobacter sp.]